MFNYVVDNRKMDKAQGADDINISGFVDDPKPPTNPNTPPVDPPPPTPPTPPTPPSDELTEFGDNTDAILSEVVSAKYNDLSLVRLNKTGDLVNTEGQVLVSKADLDKDVNTIKTELTTKAEEYIKGLGEVEIEGVTYKIEEDGSIKNEAGEVVLTKEQLLEQVMATDDYLAEPGDDDVSMYDQAAQITGLQLIDDKGEPMHFEESVEGLAMRDLHIARQEGSRIANETLNNFFTSYPELEDAFYYLKTKGTLEGFGTQTNHQGIEIKQENEAQQLEIVITAEMARGKDREAAAKYANLLKDNDMLYEESKASLAYLQTSEQNDKQSRATKYAADQAALAKEQETYWNNVATTLQTGKVLEYTIPENIRVPLSNGTVKYYTKQDFFNYMRVPVKNGLTQAQIDAQNEPLDIKIFNDYLRFTGHDMSYLVNQRVNQTKVNDLKQRFNRGGIPPKKVVIKPTARKSNNDKIVM